MLTELIRLLLGLTSLEGLTEAQKLVVSDYDVPIIIGWALLPFIVAIIYSVTHCGSVKIPAWKDIVALLGCYVVYRAVLGGLTALQTSGSLPDFFLRPFGFTFTCIPCFLAVLIYLLVIYSNFNRGASAEAAPAH